MSDESQIVDEKHVEGSPRHAHLRKLAAEAEALKKAKSNQKPVKVEYELVHDSRGKPKYRKILRMPNGNKHWVYVDPKSSELNEIKSRGGKKRLS